MRISGLASGMDTETMVKELMTAHRIPLDKLNQKKQYTEWQRDDYRTVNRTLNDFKTLTNDSMLRQATFIKKTVTSSTPEDISIKNINSVSDFSGKIKVKQLAESATMQSTGEVFKSEADLTKKLSDSTLGLVQPVGNFRINAIKEDGTFDSTLNAGYEVKITADSTMQSVIDDINKNSGVSAFYDSHTGKIAFTAKFSGDVKDTSETVKNPEIVFSGNYKFLGIEETNVIANKNGNGTLGLNAEFTYNGLTTQRQSNTFKINGFEISLKQANNKDITFSSSPDVDSILESVTKFVDEYNKLIEDLNGQIRETKYKDYQPLTDTEKEALSEDQIKKWEEKAMSGTLKNDSIISGVLNQMRNAMSSVVGSVSGANALSKLGITTSSNYLENGKLTIDETKLREAISADPNQVYELFAADGAKDSEKGLARRITSALDDARTKITTKAGSGTTTVNNSFVLGRLLEGYEDQMTRFEDRLATMESRYWKQFGAMEQAIQKANSQSTYLAGMFSTGS
ncbi:flagellar hook-associated protein 2 [Psychrobacillus psychrotolerans]|uniref:Flagellar hook-associated protein 2 n=1 Tax=Psychrobacillus psychrotolerans TaxID=126156 RepID=A0A1I5ZAQ5_9BACI|nr:flagellar hook-associated protein 2 [Psychrobacillus psychrotolerans]SFQ53542.1 flagellar hook-associated protein 2 [Psychrobacillus psychrotolerans]